MKLFVLLSGLALCCLIVIFLKARKAAAQRAIYGRQQIKSWGYFIKPPAEPNKRCPAAVARKNKPFVAETRGVLPRLPLPGCNQKVCRCTFEPMPERRKRSDRRLLNDRRFAIRFQSKIDRRTVTDRRKHNTIWKHRD